ncbi:hypothetical protein Hdeb2414_s0015g00453141 [Helianthus debilis subsp. tardiflorus]
MFPTLGGDNKQLESEKWNELLCHLDPQTINGKSKVQRIIRLPILKNKLPDKFTDLNRVTK